MNCKLQLLFVLLAVPLVLASSSSLQAPQRPVTDRYFSTDVVDNYRWLENGDDAEVATWVGAQNAYARSVLDALPARDALRTKMREMESGTQVSYFSMFARADTLFSLKYQPPKEQPVLVALSNAEDLATERVIVDPNRLDPQGGTSVDWYQASNAGKLVAVSLSTQHAERGDLHIYVAATGKETGEIVPRVNYGTAGGSAIWANDDSGFFYARYPHPGERPDADLDFYTQVYFHRLGTPVEQDRYEIGRDFSRIAEIKLSGNADGWVAAKVSQGDGRNFEQYLRSPDGHWSQLARFQDKISEVTFSADHALLLVSHANAPRGKILKLRLRAKHSPRLADAVPFVNEAATGAIQYVFTSAAAPAAPSRVYVVDQVGGPHQVRIFGPGGRSLGKLDMPAVSTVSRLVPFGDGSIAYCIARYDSADTCYRRGADSGASHRMTISTQTTVDLSDMDVIREFATSKDGTRIPFTILHRKGLALNASTPTIITGYGGYGLSEEPTFDRNFRILMDAGVTWVDTNIRGGGEYGEAWHHAGNLTNKQHGFDDFIACAERLIELHYTSPEHLAMQGSSEGGLLMGAVLTQRPDLFKAVVSDGGLYDMLRMELQANGQFNTTEIGSVHNVDQFKALYAYSPYHHVVDGQRYPHTLLLTGAVDAHVDPMQSRKMAARLQAAQHGDGMVLLRTSAADGHGINTTFSEEIEQQADMLAFEFHELGATYPAEEAPPETGSAH